MSSVIEIYSHVDEIVAVIKFDTVVPKFSKLTLNSISSPWLISPSPFPDEDPEVSSSISNS